MKQFHSIKEVAQLFGLNESTLRFWEQEFEEIAPRKNAQGKRFYSDEDIDNIRLVHYLLKIKMMTIAGARQQLKDNKSETINREAIHHRLEKIRAELHLIINALDDYEKNN
ncbi:MAG: MerR family transcriptional regulator [Tannerella sp.]|jgi:DNA-binding transcriptional MerR regulator|nr:MerR family transcriptional regulator [Tannerella sp.]